MTSPNKDEVYRLEWKMNYSWNKDSEYEEKVCERWPAHNLVTNQYVDYRNLRRATGFLEIPIGQAERLSTKSKDCFRITYQMYQNGPFSTYLLENCRKLRNKIRTARDSISKIEVICGWETLSEQEIELLKAKR